MNVYLCLVFNVSLHYLSVPLQTTPNFSGFHKTINFHKFTLKSINHYILTFYLCYITDLSKETFER